MTLLSTFKSLASSDKVFILMGLWDVGECQVDVFRIGKQYNTHPESLRGDLRSVCCGQIVDLCPKEVDGGFV